MANNALRWAWNQKTRPTAKLVLIAMADRADNAGVCWPGLKDLSERTGLSRRAVTNALRILKDDGITTPLSHPSGGHGKATTWRLNLERDATYNLERDATFSETYLAPGATYLAPDDTYLARGATQPSEPLEPSSSEDGNEDEGQTCNTCGDKGWDCLSCSTRRHRSQERKRLESQITDEERQKIHQVHGRTYSQSQIDQALQVVAEQRAKGVAIRDATRYVAAVLKQEVA